MLYYRNSEFNPHFRWQTHCVLNPVQGSMLMLHYHGESEAFPLSKGKARISPVRQLGSKPSLEEVQIQEDGCSQRLLPIGQAPCYLHICTIEQIFCLVLRYFLFLF